MKKIPKREYSQIRSILKKELDEFIVKYKRMPSKTEFMRRLRKIQLRMQSELLSATTTAFSSVYVTASLQVAQELGDKLRLTSIDQNAINVLSNKPVLRQSFAGLSQEVANKFQTLFEKAYQSEKGISRFKLQKEIQRVAEVSDHRAELIARTESAKISGTARYNQYKKRPEFNRFLFRHVGPNDSRTTETSKRIKERVGNGVTWDELYKIVTEESVKDFPTWIVDYTNLVSHFNSRHLPVKVGVLPE